MKDVDLASINKVKKMAVLVLANDDVIWHEQNRLQIVDDETLFDSGAVFQLNHVLDKVLILVIQYLVSQ